MADKGLFAPREAPIRQPTSDAQVNGRIINPPRYAQLGGLTAAGKVGPTATQYKISKPGDTK